MIKKKSNDKEQITFQDIVSALKTNEQKTKTMDGYEDEEYERVAAAEAAMIRIGKETRKYRQYMNAPDAADWQDSLANAFKFMGFKTRKQYVVEKE